MHVFRAFLEFCYIARHDVITERTLHQLWDALARFHHYRVIFEELGIRPDGFALPRQHAMSHYWSLIRLFGAPNGLCSSITESKHIKAVKEPWRRSNRYNTLSQMLLTNQHIDKLAAARIDFTNRGMLSGTCLNDALKMLGKYVIMFISPFKSVQILIYVNLEASCTADGDGVNQPDDSKEDDDNDDDDDDDDDNINVFAHVQLARTVRTSKIALA